MKRPTHEELLEGRVYTISLLNEPVDFEVGFALEPLTARAIAQRKWKMDREVVVEGRRNLAREFRDE